MQPDRNKPVHLFISATLGAGTRTCVWLSSCVSEQSSPSSGRVIAGDGNAGDELSPALSQPLPSPAQQQWDMEQHDWMLLLPQHWQDSGSGKILSLW